MPKPPLPPSTWRNDLETDLRRAAQHRRAPARGADPPPPDTAAGGDIEIDSDDLKPPF